MAARPRRVAVVFGGPSPEHDVSVLTGLQATHTLRDSGRDGEVLGIYWAKNGAFFSVDPLLEASAFGGAAPAGARPLMLAAGSPGGFAERRGSLRGDRAFELDVVLVCCHGGPGEDGSLQGAFDLAGIAYGGPSAAGAALGMDKLASAGVLAAAGVRVLPRMALYDGAPEPAFPGPYIVKPRFGGSSIGIDVVKDFPTALARLTANMHLRRGAVIEPYREDLFDLEIAARTWPKLELSGIAKPLRRSTGVEILNYADKYVGGSGMDAAPRELPAILSPTLEIALRDAARAAVAALLVRGVARIDFLSDGEELYLNEVNTIPGSLSRYLFIDPVVGFTTLLEDLLDEAVERPAARFSAAGADGTVLRDAGNIAAKLG